MQAFDTDGSEISGTITPDFQDFLDTFLHNSKSELTCPSDIVPQKTEKSVSNFSATSGVSPDTGELMPIHRIVEERVVVTLHTPRRWADY